MNPYDEHAGQYTPARGSTTIDTDSSFDSASSTRDSFESTLDTPPSRLHQGRALVWEIAQTVLLTIAIFLAVRTVVQNFRVEGASMDPTLQSGQFLLINKLTYSRIDGTPLELVLPDDDGRSNAHYVFGGPQRGEIIVFRSPQHSDKDFIKRVIGLPGETVQVVDGRVFINGHPIDEPYIKNHATYDYSARRIPSDEYFVLGDNRPNSQDSHVGWFVPAKKIIGRAWLSYWPPGQWGIMQPALYADVPASPTNQAVPGRASR